MASATSAVSEEDACRSGQRVHLAMLASGSNQLPAPVAAGRKFSGRSVQVLFGSADPSVTSFLAVAGELLR